MNTDRDRNDLKKVAARFNLGKIEDCERLSGGIINDTFKLTTSKGVFVAQRIHNMFNGRVYTNQREVSEYLTQKGFLKLPELIESSYGHISARISSRYWKVSLFIDHDKVEKTRPLIIKAAETLGRFHHTMSSYRYWIKPTVSDFHKTKKVIQKLYDFTKGYASKFHKNRMKAKRVQSQADLILEETPKHYLPRGLPTTIIHGDPKFENFLFKDGEVAAIIDMDTLMTANELIDIGDALRNWSMIGHTGFSKDIFDAALKAYLSVNKKDYIDESSALNATALLTLELAARFLIDHFYHFEGAYFQWNPKEYPSAAAHNLARCDKVLTYYKNLSKYLN